MFFVESKTMSFSLNTGFFFSVLLSVKSDDTWTVVTIELPCIHMEIGHNRE